MVGEGLDGGKSSCAKLYSIELLPFGMSFDGVLVLVLLARCNRHIYYFVEILAIRPWGHALKHLGFNS